MSVGCVGGNRWASDKVSQLLKSDDSNATFLMLDSHPGCYQGQTEFKPTGPVASSLTVLTCEKAVVYFKLTEDHWIPLGLLHLQLF